MIDELRAGAPVTINNITVTPIEKVHHYDTETRQGIWVYHTREPVAVVVSASHGVEAFDMEGREMSLPQILQMAPSLADSLEGYIER